jgi:serine/threonine protein phosphatase PrpC
LALQLWDVVDDFLVVDTIKDCLDGEECSRRLVELALSKKTKDNITVMTVVL